MKLCGIHLKQEHTEILINIVMKNIQQNNGLEILEILETLLQYNKIFLRHKVQNILLLLNETISSSKSSKEIVRKSLKIINFFEILLESQLHIEIPFLC